jgi:hypothetical protein
MKRLAVLLAAVAVLLPGAARAAACSPLDCAPSQFTLAHGTLLGVRASVQSPVNVIDLSTGETKFQLPAGIVQGDTLVSQAGQVLTWYDAATGASTGEASLDQHGKYYLAGLSQAGTVAVLAQTQKGATTFVLRSRSSSRTVTLAGSTWMFDALRGSSLYLIQGARNGYYVWLYDLRTNALRKQPLKDPPDAALIQGAPIGRVSTPDGSQLLTLYIGSNHAMIHDLDLATGQAHCIDLPGGGDYNTIITWMLVGDTDNRTAWAISPGYGRVVRIDLVTHAVGSAYEFAPGNWTSNAGLAVLAPDGKHIAFTDSEHVWLAIPDSRRVIQEPAHTTLGLGFTPDQSALWVVGKRAEVSRLTPLRWQ